MTVVVVLLVTLAGLCLGLRTTSVMLPLTVHPLDRLALAIIAGAIWTGVVFEVATSYRIYDFGLGLMLSLSPAGLFDITKWWFRSRGRRANWLRGAPAWVVAARWVFLVVLVASISAALAGI
jgi:hypothetical protein